MRAWMIVAGLTASAVGSNYTGWSGKWRTGTRSFYFAPIATSGYTTGVGHDR
jgi:uncharacterized membrane protein YhhN